MGQDVSCANFKGRTAIHMAIRAGQLDIVDSLINQGFDVNGKDIDGLTPLFYAIKSNSTACVKLLVENGTDLDEFNFKQQTPLHLAASLGSEDCVKTLLNLGASPNVLDENNFTPLSTAVDEYCLKVNDETLSRSYQSVIKHLISVTNLTSIEKLNCRGDNVMHVAMQHDLMFVIEKLIEKSPRFAEIPDASGWKPIFIATCYQKIRPIKYIVHRTNVNVNWRSDHTGYSALMYAVLCGFVDITEFLIQSGADVNAAEVSGQTSLHFAFGNAFVEKPDVRLDKAPRIKHWVRKLNKAGLRDFIYVAIAAYLSVDCKADASVLNSDNMSPIDVFVQNFEKRCDVEDTVKQSLKAFVMKFVNKTSATYKDKASWQQVVRSLQNDGIAASGDQLECRNEIEEEEEEESEVTIAVEIECNICLSRSRDVTFNPCGHGTCFICSQKLKHCHYCRTEIIGVIKTF